MHASLSRLVPFETMLPMETGKTCSNVGCDADPTRAENACSSAGELDGIGGLTEIVETVLTIEQPIDGITIFYKRSKHDRPEA